MHLQQEKLKLRVMGLWRSVIHVRDVCSALIAGIEAPRNIVSKSYNVGIHNGNFTVKELALAAQKLCLVPN